MNIKKHGKGRNIAIALAGVLIALLAVYLLSIAIIKYGKGMPVPAVPPEIVRTAVAPAQKKSNIKVTFIELGSVNCTPCVMMAKIMDEIESEYDGQVRVRFYDVNSLLGRPYAQKYGVRIIPMQVFLDKDRNEYFRHEGFFPKEELVKVLKMKGVN